MDVFEAIAARHSYREEFTDAAVPREDLEKIVQAGIIAPSGCNAQTTTFAIVDDPKLRGEIGEIVGNQVVKDAKAIIVCIVEHRAVYKDLSFGVEDCSAAVENMLLAITALGYATVWIDGALRGDNRARRIGDLLDVPGDREVRIVLPVGVPAHKRTQPEKMAFAERAWFNRFETT
jgi:nitroreductase